MNHPNPETLARWTTLLAQARADEAPPIDTAALHRVIEDTWSAQPERSGDWMQVVLATCDLRRTLWWWLGGAIGCVALTGWHLWTAAQDLAWARFAGVMAGGAL